MRHVDVLPGHRLSPPRRRRALLPRHTSPLPPPPGRSPLVRQRRQPRRP